MYSFNQGFIVDVLFSKEDCVDQLVCSDENLYAKGVSILYTVAMDYDAFEGCFEASKVGW
jgi:hypothetical protein